DRGRQDVERLAEMKAGADPAPAPNDLSSFTISSRASRRELVLEAEEVEEVEIAGVVAVGVLLAGGEGVLEAEEVEEVESAGLVAVGVAGGAAGADGEAAGGHAANAVEAAADPEIAIDHFEAEDAAVRAAAYDFPCAAGELQR